MKIPYLVIALFLMSCNQDKTEMPCDCNEIKDKRFVLNTPLPPLKQIYVQDCETDVLTWVTVTSEQFNDNYLGECWSY